MFSEGGKFSRRSARRHLASSLSASLRTLVGHLPDTRAVKFSFFVIFFFTGAMSSSSEKKSFCIEALLARDKSEERFVGADSHSNSSSPTRGSSISPPISPGSEVIHPDDLSPSHPSSCESPKAIDLGCPRAIVTSSSGGGGSPLPTTFTTSPMVPRPGLLTTTVPFFSAGHHLYYPASHVGPGHMLSGSAFHPPTHGLDPTGLAGHLAKGTAGHIPNLHPMQLEWLAARAGMLYPRMSDLTGKWKKISL